MPGGLEAPHAPLSFSRRLVRVLCAVVQALVWAMPDTRHYFGLSRRIATELICDDRARCIAQPLEQFAQETLSGPFIALGLHQNVEHFAILVDGSPQILEFAIDSQKYLIQVPSVAEPAALAAKLPRIGVPKLLPATLHPLHYFTLT